MYGTRGKNIIGWVCAYVCIYVYVLGLDQHFQNVCIYLNICMWLNIYVFVVPEILSNLEQRSMTGKKTEIVLRLDNTGAWVMEFFFFIAP